MLHKNWEMAAVFAQKRHRGLVVGPDSPRGILKSFLSFVSLKPTWLLVSWLRIHRCCKGWNCQKFYCSNTCNKKEIHLHRLWIWPMQGYLFNENPLCNLLIMKIWPLSTDLIPNFPINTAPQLLHKFLKPPFVYIYTVTLWFGPQYVGTGKGDCKSFSAA